MPKKFTVIIEFDDQLAKHEFIGWMCDGGGDQQFAYNERFDDLTITYVNIGARSVNSKIYVSGKVREKRRTY